MTPPSKQVLKYSTTAVTIVGLLLTGNLINNDVVDVTPDKDFDCNSTVTFAASTDNLTWSGATLVTLSLLLPVLPLLSSSTADRSEALVSHVLGQSCNFAGSKFIQHFVVSPDNSFAPLCNLTYNQCSQLSLQHVSLFSPINVSLCTNDSPLLHAALRSVPDLVLTVFGASLVTFGANLYQLQKNKVTTDKSVSCYKMTAATWFMFTVATAIIYCCDFSKHDSQQMLVSFAFGIGLQLVIYSLYQMRYSVSPPTPICIATKIPQI